MNVKWRLLFDDLRDVSSLRSWLFHWFHWSPPDGSVTVLRLFGVSVHRYRYKRTPL